MMKRNDRYSKMNSCVFTIKDIVRLVKPINSLTSLECYSKIDMSLEKIIDVNSEKE